jgi:hypothetical protein
MDTATIIGRAGATCAALLTAALGLCVAAQQDEEAEPTAAATDPRACLAHPTIDRTKILNGRNIVFVTRDDTIYNNQLPKECPTLNRRSLVNYGIQNGRMCAGDRFQVLWESGPGRYQPSAMCQLGTFVPITESELDDLVTMTEENRERSRRGRSKREAVTTEEVELPPTAPAPAPDAAETTSSESD